VPSPRKAKDKAHAALDAESLDLIGEKITTLAGDPVMRAATTGQMLYALANIFYNEAGRVRTIDR
jgi:hypothetical protein